MKQDDSEIEVAKALYTQLHAHNLFLRERLFQITSAAVSIFLVADGWLVSSGSNVTWLQRGLVIVGALLVSITTIYALHSHYREYLASAKMIVRCERAMGAYEPGRYFETECLYEAESAEWGTGKFSSHLIRTYFIIVILFTVFSCVAAVVV